MSDYSDYEGTWVIDPTHTRLGFVARHAMVTKVRGQFEEFAGTLVIDAANPSASTATVTVQLASVNTGTPDRDAHLRSADFFDVENNREMTFTSTAVKQDGDGFVMVGDLTIKGVTREIAMPVTINGPIDDPWGNTRVGVEGATTITAEAVAFGSERYFALLAAHPEIGRYLALGDRVTVMADGKAYAISPDAQEAEPTPTPVPAAAATGAVPQATAGTGTVPEPSAVTLCPGAAALGLLGISVPLYLRQLH